MAYTVGELTELVFLRITGGKPTPDSTVLRSDIRMYIPDAVNALMVKHYIGEQQLETNLKPNPLFLQIFPEISPVLNADRGKFEFQLPERAISLPDAKSVRSVETMYGMQYEPFDPTDGTLGSFWIQTNRQSPAYTVTGETVTLYNRMPGNVLVKMIVHIDSYTNDSIEIFVPSGMENELVDNLYNAVMAQRSNPDDRIADGKEDSK